MMEQKQFGVAKTGQTAYLYTFENHKKMRMTVTNLGAILTNLWVPDKKGSLQDVVLGFDTLQDYEGKNFSHFGATIGRSANRLANARFELAGVTYQLAKNDGENNLHSGPNGYQLRVWSVKEIQEEQRTITFALLSPDGDQGYPGQLELTVTYQLTEDAVVITYSGKSDTDTIFNPTNHSYFNLNGHQNGTILNHRLQLAANMYTPIIDSGSIPTGEIQEVAQTPMDFRSEKTIGKDIDAEDQQLIFANGYDHNYVLEDTEIFATLTGDQSGIVMEAATNLPGVQFYSGNFLDNVVGKSRANYQFRAGLCLETQFFPNAINEFHFSSPLLEANQPVTYWTSYTFSTEK